MKRQIRRSCFETNSSSTHAICITNNDVDKNNLPNHVTFTHGEFGWEFDVHEDTWTKASYLYQAICGLYDGVGAGNQKYLDRITELLAQYGISCEFEPSKDGSYWENGYIDHVHDTSDFVEAVLANSETLLRYLFGDSMIVTGNDNGDSFYNYMYEDDSWNYSSPLKAKFNNYEVYMKGN